MNIVNIGTDKTLVGGASLGDAVERHRAYGRHLDHLDIIVYSPKREGLKEFKIADNVIGHPTNSWSKLGFMKDAERLFAKIHAQHKVDLIVCQDPFGPAVVGARLKKKYGVKLQINFHGDFFDNPFWLREHVRHRYYRRLAEKTILKADTIRIVSEALRPKLTKRYVKNEDIYVIPTPVNLEKFQAEPSPQRFDRPIILTVGRIVKAKDFPILLATARLLVKQVSGLEWRIIGDGPLRRKFERQTSSTLPQLKWLNALPHDQLRPHYQAASVLVSTSNNESFGKVFLEAAMAQVPVVATATLGANNIVVNGETGFLAPIGDPQRLAERIAYLILRPELVAQMGEQAKQHALSRFGWQRSIDAMVQMWRQTVGHS